MDCTVLPSASRLRSCSTEGGVSRLPEQETICFSLTTLTKQNASVTKCEWRFSQHPYTPQMDASRITAVMSPTEVNSVLLNCGERWIPSVTALVPEESSLSEWASRKH